MLELEWEKGVPQRVRKLLNCRRLSLRFLVFQGGNSILGLNREKLGQRESTKIAADEGRILR